MSNVDYLDKASLIFMGLLLLAGTVMACWGVLGFIEYIFGTTILMPLQNPTFPPGTQFVHWLLITISGFVFLIGYFTKWKYTPISMVAIFTGLATLCSIETFDFMTNESRYVDFFRELFWYIVISVYLLRSNRMRKHFGRLNVVEYG